MLECNQCGLKSTDWSLHREEQLKAQLSTVEAELDDLRVDLQELCLDHSTALAFVREIAAGECQAPDGCECLPCRARIWLHTEGLQS